MIPLIVAAMAAGAGRTGIGVLQNRGNARRQRRLIHEAYRNSADRLTTQQTDVRQNSDESLNARGLFQGGQERIDASTELNSTNAKVTRPLETAQPIVRTPRTLAGQTQADTERELGYEWRDLDFQRAKEEGTLKAAGQQQTMDDIAAGIKTAASVYSMGSTASAGKIATAMGAVDQLAGGVMPTVSQVPKAPNLSPKLSPIASAMTGVEHPENWWGGIHGIDPLDAPASNWNRTKLGTGQMNAEFGA